MNILLTFLILLLQAEYVCQSCVAITPSPTLTATPINTATPLPTPSPTATATPQPAITPTATPAPVVTINFQEDVNAIFGNPYIGFESTQRPINEVSNPRGIPSTSIEFGQYMNEGFSNIDAMITKARASNQTILLRLAAYDPDYGQYLKNILPGFNFRVPSESSSGPHFAPDLNNAQVLARIRSDLAAFGARYNSNPTIEHVDWRIIGLWGEQHHSGMEPAVALPSEASSNHIYQSFQLAFPNKQKIAILDGRWARKLAVTTPGVGLRMDCWGGDANHEGPGNLYQQWYSDPPAVADIWREGPVVLEPCGALSSGNITNKVNLAIARHASLINTKNGFNVPESQWSEWQRLLRKLGYRFVLRRAVISQGLTLHIENVGIAPNYKPLRVENATTGLAVTLSKVMPGETRLAVLPGNRGDVIRFSIDGKVVRTANSTYNNGVLIP